MGLLPAQGQVYLYLQDFAGDIIIGLGIGFIAAPA
jgi:hypothetical protein